MDNTKQLSFKKNFSWNFIGNLIYSLSQGLILVLLAKIGGAELVGLYTLGFSLTAPIIMLTNLQLRQVQATDTTSTYIFNDYFGLRIITGFVAILITLAVIAIGDYDSYKAIIIVLIALSKVIDSYSEVIYGQLQQRERMDYIGVSRAIKGCMTLLTITIVLIITDSIVWALIALNISSILIFLLYDKNKIKHFINTITPSFNWIKQKKLIILTLPLGLMLMLGSLNTNIPRILVERFLGEEALGYFGGIAYFLVAGNMFVSAIGQAGAPRLAKYFSSDMYKEFKRLLNRLVLIGFSIGLMGLLISSLFGNIILQLVYDSSYGEYKNILMIVMVAGVFSYSSSFLGYGLTAMRIFNVQPYLGSVWVLVSIICSIILIPKFGLIGAAITLVLASMIQFLTTTLVIIINIKSKEKVKLSEYK